MEQPVGAGSHGSPAIIGDGGLSDDRSPRSGVPNPDSRQVHWRRHGKLPPDQAFEPLLAAHVAMSADPDASASFPWLLQSLLEADLQHLRGPELLELLLHFGRSAQNAGQLSALLLDHFGSLSAVIAADAAKLTSILNGDIISVSLLKTVRAWVQAILREPLEDRPVIGSASALMDYLSITMRHEPIEMTRVLFLDRKNALIKDEILHRGTVDHTPLYPREVVRRVVELGASALILVHNHPSGDPKPSREDIKTTRLLAAALSSIEVLLHDHVIVGRNRHCSFRKSGLL